MRSSLIGLGAPVVARPVFAGGFGVGDLVVGATLIDVKVAE
jgi:hypothetical protein